MVLMSGAPSWERGSWCGTGTNGGSYAGRPARAVAAAAWSLLRPRVAGARAGRGRSGRCRRSRSGSTAPGAAPSARRRAAYPRRRGRPARARRRRSGRPRRRAGGAASARCGRRAGRSPRVTPPSVLDRRGRGSARSSAGQAALHRGGVRLAAERRAQLVQAVLGLVPERAAVAGVGREPGVDEVGVVVVVELDDHLARPRQRGQRVLGVRGHQVGEVRRAERRRQPQVRPRRAVAGDLERAHEAEVGDRLVELGVEHRRQRVVGRLARSAACRAAVRSGRAGEAHRQTPARRSGPARSAVSSAPRGPVAGSSASGSRSSAGHRRGRTSWRR